MEMGICLAWPNLAPFKESLQIIASGILINSSVLNHVIGEIEFVCLCVCKS